MNELMLRILVLVVTMLSPALQEALKEFIVSLEKEARKTANPWDDILVAILKVLLTNQK